MLSWLSRSNKLPQATDHSNMNTVYLLLTGRKWFIYLSTHKNHAVSTLNFCCYCCRFSSDFFSCRKRQLIRLNVGKQAILFSLPAALRPPCSLQKHLDKQDRSKTAWCATAQSNVIDGTCGATPSPCAEKFRIFITFMHT